VQAQSSDPTGVQQQDAHAQGVLLVTRPTPRLTRPRPGGGAPTRSRRAQTSGPAPRPPAPRRPWQCRAGTARAPGPARGAWQGTGMCAAEAACSTWGIHTVRSQIKDKRTLGKMGGACQNLRLRSLSFPFPYPNFGPKPPCPAPPSAPRGINRGKAGTPYAS